MTVNKGDKQNPECRARLAAKEVKKDNRDDNSGDVSDVSDDGNGDYIDINEDSTFTFKDIMNPEATNKGI